MAVRSGLAVAEPGGVIKGSLPAATYDSSKTMSSKERTATPAGPYNFSTREPNNFDTWQPRQRVRRRKGWVGRTAWHPVKGLPLHSHLVKQPAKSRYPLDNQALRRLSKLAVSAHFDAICRHCSAGLCAGARHGNWQRAKKLQPLCLSAAVHSQVAAVEREVLLRRWLAVVNQNGPARQKTTMG